MRTAVLGHEQGSQQDCMELSIHATEGIEGHGSACRLFLMPEPNYNKNCRKIPQKVLLGLSSFRP